MYISTSFFDAAAQKGIDINIEKAISGDLQESFNFILGGIYCYSETLKQLDAKDRQHITQQQIRVWATTHPDSFAEALQSVASQICKIKKCGADQDAELTARILNTGINMSYRNNKRVS